MGDHPRSEDDDDLSQVPVAQARRLKRAMRKEIAALPKSSPQAHPDGHGTPESETIERLAELLMRNLAAEFPGDAS